MDSSREVGFILIFSFFLFFHRNTGKAGGGIIEENQLCKDLNHNAVGFIRMGITQTKVIFQMAKRGFNKIEKKGERV